MNTDKEYIKYLKSLLYETIEFIVAEKSLRGVWQGPDERLDRDADKLVEEIKSLFTQAEMEEALKALYKKYEQPKKTN